jgi:hypothetical protein
MQSGIHIMTRIAVTPAALHNRKVITMTTKELIKKRFTETKEPTVKPGLLARLQTIQIDGPEDFSENLDLYLSGEKHAE